MPPKKKLNEKQQTHTLENLYEKGEMKDFIKLKEQMEIDSQTAVNMSDKDYLYPSLDDPLFNPKIASRKEFYDSQYDGKIKDVKQEAERICNAEFELAPHQTFVRNFLSFQTPYNSLLLYHGLGSGKTCSAISVAEEMRDYMKQMGINQRIIIVAAPNIQDNFRLQLFDERKLQEVDGYWNIRACVGNKLLREINPMNVRGLPKEKVITHVKRIINNSYLFLGYIEFANYIAKKGELGPNDPDAGDTKKMAIKQAMKLRKVFDNRLIIIDEVHDIRVSDDNKKKRVAYELMRLVKSTENLRLLLLSATPMYNSYKEIIWLLNLMNINDKRAPIELKDVFDEDGDFKTDSKGNEVGRELLERKATGYVSFVRGENPYMFPYKIWPEQFAPRNSIQGKPYPKYQMNRRQVIQTLQYLQLYVSNIGVYQQKGYDFIIEQLRKNAETGIGGLRGMPNFENMESFGYTMLQRPLEALNIVYPFDKLDDFYEDKAEDKEKEKEKEIKIEARDLVGKHGLQRVMSYVEKDNPPFRGKFEYKTEKYGRIFAPDEIGKYSSKIKSICDAIINSEGIVLVYSQYIDGGLVPVALALEELGFTRYGKVPSLFSKQPVPTIDSTTYEPLTKTGKDKKGSGKPASYVMITGDKAISPDNLADFIAATNTDNQDGSIVKVVLLSQAGGQGLDFTNIRQVHILEPWYNMNRAEQVIGRGVRSCSHKMLPFDKHNVQIYLHGTLMPNADEEAADLYVYRVAETKAVQIGRISRVLKEIAVDCLLNMEQQNFTELNMKQVVKQKLSIGKTIDYSVGDKPYSFTCDYMETCEYKCRPVSSIKKEDVKLDTYNEAFIEMNNDRILQRVRQLFKEKHMFDKEELINSINAVRTYPLIQINSALNQLVSERNELVTDMFGRLGRVVNIERLYLFQPMELTNTNQSLYNRRVPLQVKRTAIKLPNVNQDVKDKTNEQIEKVGQDVSEVKKIKIKGKIRIIKKDTRRKIDTEQPETIQQTKDTQLKLKVNTKYGEIIDTIKTNYETAFSDIKIDKGEENWYKQCSLAVKRMEAEGIEKPVLEELVLNHIIQELMFDDLIILLNGIYSILSNKLSDIEKRIKHQLEQMMMKAKGTMGFFWVKDNTHILIAKHGDEPWGKAEAEDWVDLDNELRKVIIPKTDYNKVVGFITDFKNEVMVFKVKNMEKKRHKGARCDQSGKKEALATLNTIVGDEVYTIENTKDMGQKEICVLQELTLRIYERQKKDDKVWFLAPGVAAINQIEKISWV